MTAKLNSTHSKYACSRLRPVSCATDWTAAECLNCACSSSPAASRDSLTSSAPVLPAEYSACLEELADCARALVSESAKTKTKAASVSRVWRAIREVRGITDHLPERGLQVPVPCG